MNNLNLDNNLRHARVVKMSQSKRGRTKEDAQEMQVKQMESEIDFEVNQLLKNEIVELKLEVEQLRKEKQNEANRKSQQEQEILRKKQQLEQINIDINRGRPSNEEYFLQKKEFARKEDINRLEQRVLKDRIEALEAEIAEAREDRENGKFRPSNRRRHAQRNNCGRKIFAGY